MKPDGDRAYLKNKSSDRYFCLTSLLEYEITFEMQKNCSDVRLIQVITVEKREVNWTGKIKLKQRETVIIEQCMYKQHANIIKARIFLIKRIYDEIYMKILFPQLNCRRQLCQSDTVVKNEHLKWKRWTIKFASSFNDINQISVCNVRLRKLRIIFNFVSYLRFYVTHSVRIL